MKILDAAEWMNRVYYDRPAADIEAEISLGTVQATYLKNGTLVIPGTNEPKDWLTNLNLFGPRDRAEDGMPVMHGDSRLTWHAGFLEHARTVYAFAKPLKPKLIIGHSLGAAAAQIVGSSLRVPTIAFASPRPLHEGRNAAVAGAEYVLNLLRMDDAVCYVPMGLLGFRHVGRTLWMSRQGGVPGEDHRIPHYIDILKDAIDGGAVPESWPEDPTRVT